MKYALAILALILAAITLPFMVPALSGRQEAAQVEKNLPWQIDIDGKGGSRVFGLEPGRSTLEDAVRQFGDDMEVAMIAAPDEEGSVEAYFSQVTLGFVLARVILTVDVPKETISAMRERALLSKHMESTTRKITLHADDRVKVRTLPIRAIGIIPNASLDEATITQRFGAPGERLAVSEKRVHLLYPKLGLDVIVDQDGKEFLQYVAPASFSILRDPLGSGKQGE